MCIETYRQNMILKYIEQKGIPRDCMMEVKEEFAKGKKPEGQNYYYYIGPDDSKTRKFCHQLLKFDKVVSETDIEILSKLLNYDVKKYKGSYNCRHTWVKFRGKILPTNDLTVNQIKQLARLGIKG